MGTDKRKKNVIIMEPTPFFSDGMLNCLEEFMGDSVIVLGVVESISALMRFVVMNGPADIYLVEAYGKNESYENWLSFTKFIANNYQNSLCLVWSSKPTIFIRKFTCKEMKIRPWQMHKKIDVMKFIEFFFFLINENIDKHKHPQVLFGPPLFSLSCREILITSRLVEGDSIFDLSKKIGLDYKTVSSHKRNAMNKMNISSDSQLRSMLIDGELFSKNVKKDLFFGSCSFDIIRV